MSGPVNARVLLPLSDTNIIFRFSSEMIDRELQCVERRAPEEREAGARVSVMVHYLLV